MWGSAPLIVRAAEAGAGWGCAAVSLVKDTGTWRERSRTLSNFQRETATEVFDLQLGLGIWSSLFLTESRGRG